MRTNENKADLPIKEIIGDNLKKLREAQGLTFEDVCVVARVTPGYLALVERGMRCLKTEDLRSVAEFLNVTVDDLFSYEEGSNFISKRVHKLINEIKFWIPKLPHGEKKQFINEINEIT